MHQNKFLPENKQKELDIAYSLFKRAFVSGSYKAEKQARQSKNSLMLRLKEEGYGECIAIKGEKYSYTIDEILESYKLSVK